MMNTIGKILWLTSRVNTAVTLCCVCSGAVCENGVMSRDMKTNICVWACEHWQMKIASSASVGVWSQLTINIKTKQIICEQSNKLLI